MFTTFLLRFRERRAPSCTCGDGLPAIHTLRISRYGAEARTKLCSVCYHQPNVLRDITGMLENVCLLGLGGRNVKPDVWDG